MPQHVCRGSQKCYIELEGKDSKCIKLQLPRRNENEKKNEMTIMQVVIIDNKDNTTSTQRTPEAKKLWCTATHTNKIVDKGKLLESIVLNQYTKP
jgi:glycerol-3-phosphate O-acyltransferase